MEFLKKIRILFNNLDIDMDENLDLADLLKFLKYS